MESKESSSFTAFSGSRKITCGSLKEVAEKLREQGIESNSGSTLVIDDATGRVVDLDPGPGRPKLGVVSREVTLLPQHWDWLSTQKGGASLTLRKLVEEASRASAGRDRFRVAQDRAYRFMHALAGDRPGYEEALRALYARDSKEFKRRISGWPKDIREHAEKLSAQAF